jgi:flagellar biosynthesis/type III secretory pathway chaperone
MTRTVIDAADQLSELLEQENAALQRMDIAAATALVEAKQQAIAALVAAQSQAAPQEAAEFQASTQRLSDLAAANRSLLERAILVQDRVLGMIATALPRASGREGGYGAGGRNLTPNTLPPMALSARA